MIAYEVLKPIHISYRDESYKGMYLQEGDFFFIEQGYWTRKGSVGKYKQTCILKKIVFKGGALKIGEDGEAYFDKFWEEEDNINIVNPLIDGRISIEHALSEEWIAESVAWKRDDILEKLGL